MSTSMVKSKKKKRKSYRSKRYIYTLGDNYPGIVAGHEYCVAKKPRNGNAVPANMGWLWNLSQRQGWRPGALGKSILKLMRLKLAQPTTVGDSSRRRSSRKRKVVEKQDGIADDFPSELEDEDIEPQAALLVSRQGDVITITVHPLRQVTEIEDGENPFMDCDPIVFKIIQQATPEKAAKRIAKERKKCEDNIKKSLEKALQDICQCAYEDVYCTDLDAIDAVIDKAPLFDQGPQCTCDVDSEDESDSDWELEYTPPFAMVGLKQSRPTMVHQETQYLESDCQKKVKMPKIGAESSPMKVARASARIM